MSSLQKSKKEVTFKVTVSFGGKGAIVKIPTSKSKQFLVDNEKILLQYAKPVARSIIEQSIQKRLQEEKTFNVTVSFGGKGAIVRIPISKKQEFLADKEKILLQYAESVGRSIIEQSIQKRLAEQPLQIEWIRQKRVFKNLISEGLVQINNWKQVTTKNMTEFFKTISPQSSFRMGCVLPNGQVQPRFFSKQDLIKTIENDFKITNKQLGSDAQEELEYTLDLSRPFQVSQVSNASELKLNCNRAQNTLKLIGRCEVLDVYTRRQNCGYQSLKVLGYVTDVPKEKQGGLSVNDMIALCEKFDFPIQIINEDGKVSYSHPEFELHEKPDDHTLVYCISSQHWYVFKSFKYTKTEYEEIQKKNQEKKDKKHKKNEVKEKRLSLKTLLVFYDIESVFNHNKNSMAQSYHLSYFPIPLQKKMPEITKENLWMFKKNTRVLKGEDACQRMVWELKLEYHYKDYTYKFISFNGSSFDDYFLIDQAVDNLEDIKTAIFSNKSILGLTFSYGKCWDLRKFLTIGSLEKNCESFGTYPPKMKGFDHRLPQKAFDEGRLEEWMQENKVKLEEYNKLDVLSLYSLTMKFRDQVLQLFETSDDNLKMLSDVFQHNTIGSQTYALCKYRWKLDGIEMRRPVDAKTDEYIRKCLTAGRTQVMATQDGSSIHINGVKLQLVDVCSLYPAVMMDPMNFYPRGDQVQVTQRDKSKMGFYHIYVTHRKDLPNVLPERDFTGESPLDWNCKKRFETWCCSIDLDVLEKYGHQVEVIDGVEFQTQISGDKLFACQDVFKQEKIRQDIYKNNQKDFPGKYNPAMRDVCKLYLNGLSGKVIQRNFEQKVEIVHTHEEWASFINSCKPDTVISHMANEKFAVLKGEKLTSFSMGAKPSYIGVFIYAHARKLMYEQIYTKVETLYTDTDSALMKYDNFLKFKENNPLFKKETVELEGKTCELLPFGSLECELPEYDKEGKNWIGCDEAVLIAPKNYLVCNKSLNIFPKIKCKGVSFKGDYCKEHEKKEGIVKCEKCDEGFCRYEDGVPLYQDKPRLFTQLVAKGECKVICQQLAVKTFTNKYNDQVGVQYREVTKTITAKSFKVSP